ncbi:MAG: hypothetical protein ABIR47_03540 [Candidatus Kapaibacterium sp.]
MQPFRRIVGPIHGPARQSPDLQRLAVEAILGAHHLPDGSLVAVALRALSPMEWADMERYIRKIIAFPWHRDASLWEDITPSKLLEFYLTESWDLTRVGLYSLHRNGYLREAAVRIISGTPDRAGIHILLLRLNDHVPVIRNIATEAIRERIVPAYCDRWIEALPFLNRLKEMKRGSHGWLAVRVYEMLHLPECRGALQAGLASPDPLIHRSAFSIIADGDPANIEHLRNGLDDLDLAVRRDAVKRIAGIPDDDLFVAMVRMALTDPMSGIRSAAAAMTGRRMPEAAGDILHDSLFDPAPMMRAIARHHLKPDADIPEIYRAEVARNDDRTLAGAIAGLGETGTSRDAVTADALRDHPRGRVRQVATQAYLQLADQIAPDEILRILSNPTPRISREILSAPGRHLRAITIDQLMAGYIAGLDHVRRNITQLARRLSKWEQIILLIETISFTEPESADRDALYVEIEGWRNRYNRRQTQPTPRQTERMRDAMARNGALLTRAQRTELEFITRSLRG